MANSNDTNPAANEDHPLGQLPEVEEVGAVDQVLGAGEVERPGSRPRCDQELSRLIAATVDDELVFGLEGGGAMQ